jgi:hypothetical protein
VTDWWEQAYAGGPMVKLPGFPRPLYPPEAAAHGKQPSIPGPDVEAYKRTVWRAGRWQGPASGFDEAYSDRFALGAGPNVIDTGIAGVQRQQDIDDTGWIGTKTFNTLRSIRVPEGPHAGEMAMDDYAVELLVQAWKRYGGHEPNDGRGTVRDRALERACEELGVKESPPESNNVLYTDWYGMVGPWCAMFVTWCFERAADDLNTDSPAFIQGGRYAYVPYLIADARAAKYGLSVTDDPIPGDLVCYDWGWDGEYDHVGIFECWQNGAVFDAIEGNTSTSDNSNGGQVMRRMRDRQAQATTFIRVGEPA